MTRTLHANMVTAATAETGEYCYLLSFAFSGGTLFLTTASQDIDWSGDTYQAIGGLIWESIPETRELTDQAVRVTLDGVDQTIITTILQQNYLGKAATIRLAHFSAGAVIANPALVWSGLMNESWRVRESRGASGGTTRVETAITSPLVLFRQTRGIRANVVSHSHIYSGDTFWRHLQAITGRPVYWGGVITQPNAGAGTSGTGVTPFIPGPPGGEG